MTGGDPILAIAAASNAGESWLRGPAERRRRLVTIAAPRRTAEMPVEVENDMIVNRSLADVLGDGQVQAPVRHGVATGSVGIGMAACRPTRVKNMGGIGLINRPGAGPAECCA